MTDQKNPTPPRRTRRTAFVIIAVLVIVIVAFIGIGFYTAFGPASPADTTSPAAASASPTSVTASPTVSVIASPTGTPTAVPKASPVPTKSSTITAPAPITKSLTASVSKMAAVQGKAQGPGEVSGAAVQFTITIDNATSKSFDLKSTVVNVYYGSSSTPANQLEKPGGKDFPSSVKSGSTASGVFVFVIPEAQRDNVEVTVDTSTTNPVVALKGSAPTS